jgi:hypothetical protein
MVTICGLNTVDHWTDQGLCVSTLTQVASGCVGEHP